MPTERLDTPLFLYFRNGFLIDHIQRCARVVKDIPHAFENMLLPEVTIRTSESNILKKDRVGFTHVPKTRGAVKLLVYITTPLVLRVTAFIRR